MSAGNNDRQRIIIIGAGFAGLSLARDLNGTDYEVFLIDKHNYHQFQPLMYQLATARLYLRRRSDLRPPGHRTRMYHQLLREYPDPVPFLSHEVGPPGHGPAQQDLKNL